MTIVSKEKSERATANCKFMLLVTELLSIEF